MIYFFRWKISKHQQKKQKQKKTPKTTMGGKKTTPRKYQQKLKKRNLLTKHPTIFIQVSKPDNPLSPGCRCIVVL